MTDPARLLVALAVGSVAVYYATPIAIRAATHLDFFDRPRGYRGHGTPTPYLGGAAVMAGFAVTLLLLSQDMARTLPLLGGVLVLWGVGTIDDRQNVSPLTRATIEVALAVAVWSADMGWKLGLGSAVDLVATCLWVLGVVNAFNLFDNMDGASSTMALVVSAATAATGVVVSDPWVTTAGAALAGACLGFLPHNLARPNAKIFLGDGGSMPLGFAVATLVMTASSTAAAEWQALMIGLLLVAIPALDTALVIVSRRRKGISVLTGGRDHLTHRTHRRMHDARAVAVTLGSAQAVVAALAIIAVHGGSAVVLGVTALFIAVAGGIITALEGEEDRLVAAGEVTIPEAALAAAAKKRGRPRPQIGPGDLVTLGAGVATGISPFFFGFYDSSKWVPIGLGVIVVATVGAIQRPPAATRAGWLAFGGMIGYGLWALVSSRYAQSAEQATVEAGRWLVLAGMFGFALVFVRSPRRDQLLLAGLLAGTAIVAGDVIVRMFGSAAANVFVGGRLNAPLGYINAEGTVFVMGMWLCFTFIERRGHLVTAVAVGGATVMACLVLLTQSRGAAIATAASGLVVLGALGSRERRAYAVLLIAAAVAIASRPLLDVYDVAVLNGGTSTPGAIHAAARAALLAGVGTALAWWVVASARSRLLDDVGRTRLSSVGRRALAAGVVLVLAVAVVKSGSVVDRVDTQWRGFTQLSEPTASNPSNATSRLVSGAGNRYDYWRVAWETFKAHPVGGVGAGNYPQAWFKSRATAEDVRQPHSLELQALSEGGLVGGLFVLLIIAGIATGVARARRLVAARPDEVAIAVPATGVAVAWLVHTSVDWMHLIPGLTAAALGSLAVITRRRPELDAALSPERAEARRPLRVATVVGVAIAIAASGALLTRQGLAEHYLGRSLDQVADDPQSAIVDADRSLRLDGNALRAYYAKAAAEARLNQGDDALRTLEEAVRREPDDFVTWTLLGDLATRLGDSARAREYYGQAAALNPLDPELRRLAGGGASG